MIAEPLQKTIRHDLIEHDLLVSIARPGEAKIGEAGIAIGPVVALERCGRLKEVDWRTDRPGNRCRIAADFAAAVIELAIGRECIVNESSGIPDVRIARAELHHSGF